MDYTSGRSDFRQPGWEHIPAYPRGFIGIRVVQLFVATGVAGLNAYGIWDFLEHGGGVILTMLISIAVAGLSIIYLFYHLLYRTCFLKAYNYWFILGFDIALLIGWCAAAGFITLDFLVPFDSDHRVHVIFPWPSRHKFSDTRKREVPLQLTAGGLGGIEIILFLISLIIHAVCLHRHRKIGLNSRPGKPRGNSYVSGFTGSPTPNNHLNGLIDPLSPVGYASQGTVPTNSMIINNPIPGALQSGGKLGYVPTPTQPAHNISVNNVAASPFTGQSEGSGKEPQDQYNIRHQDTGRYTQTESPVQPRLNHVASFPRVVSPEPPASVRATSPETPLPPQAELPSTNIATPTQAELPGDGFYQQQGAGGQHAEGHYQQWQPQGQQWQQQDWQQQQYSQQQQQWQQQQQDQQQQWHGVPAFNTYRPE